MENKPKKKHFFEYAVGGIFILIMLLIAALPYFAIMPENIFTNILTILLCLFVLLCEVVCIALILLPKKDFLDYES